MFPGLDLPELASDVSSNDVEEVSQCSTGVFGKRSSRRRTGRLVTVNNQKIALFKYKGTVYAVDEMCPHMGGFCLENYIKFFIYHCTSKYSCTKQTQFC